MNCQEVLGWLETGGPLQRWRARAHARRCASCAAAVEAWEQCRRSLADIPELSAEQQRAWQAAADEAEVVPHRGRPGPVVWIAAAAGLACVVLALWLALRQAPREGHAEGGGDRTPDEQKPAPREAVARDDAFDEDTRVLRAGLEQLAEELVALQPLAQTIDERRLADTLLEDHAQRLESQSPEGQNQ